MKDTTHLQRLLQRAAMHKLLAALAIAVLLACFASAALADFIPPPPVSDWFYLENQTGTSLHLRGARLLGCEDAACRQTVILKGFGKCDAPECRSGEVKQLRGMNLFTCDDQSCYALTDPMQIYHYGDHRLVLQYSDRARTHPGSMEQFGRSNAWRVIVRPDSLELVPTMLRQQSRPPLPVFLFGLEVTLAVELLVAGLVLAFGIPFLERKKASRLGFLASGPPWRRLSSGEMLASLVKIFLANLISYPVVWFTFPALRSFVSSDEQMFATLILLFTWAWAVASGVFFNLKSIAWRVVMIIGMLLAAVYSGYYFLLIYMFGGNYYIESYEIAPGLRPPVILLLSEIYAVAIEALLLTWYSRRRIPWRYALAVSFLINLSSFALGWIWWFT